VPSTAFNHKTYRRFYKKSRKVVYKELESGKKNYNPREISLLLFIVVLRYK